MYTYIKAVKEFNYKEFFSNLGSAELLVVDTEASSLDPFVANWILLQVKIKEEIYIFDVRTLDRKFVIFIIELLRSSKKRILFHNAKYDLKIIYKGTGIYLNTIYDSMIVESLISRGLSDNKVYYSLEELVEKYCDVLLNKEIRKTFIEIGDNSLSNEQLIYSAEDVMYLEKIYKEQMISIEKFRMGRVLDIEMKLIPVLCDMELSGIFLDKEEWLELEKSAILESDEFKKKVLEIISNKIDYQKFETGLDLANAFHIPVKRKADETALSQIKDPSAIKDWVLSNFNINSSKQLQEVLNSVFNLKTDSTNEKLLKDLNDVEIVPSILKYREANKKISTWGESFLRYIHPVTGRVHSEFIQNGTKSGRLSSSDPDMQNIPSDKNYRRPFKAELGNSLISLDYSQQEYRLAGAVSREPRIIEAYKLGKDMHTATAAILFNKDLFDVTKEERNRGKTINFAVLYGSTAYGLSFNLKIPEAQARQILRAFSTGYPVLDAFKTELENEIWKLKYSSTLFGRKRFWDNKQLFDDYKQATKYESRVKREGFNHVIQGTGADITKLAMIKVFNDNPFGNDMKLILQVHDEIVVEVKKGIEVEAENFCKRCMLDVFQPVLGEIPASVESHIGDFWTK